MVNSYVLCFQVPKHQAFPIHVRDNYSNQLKILWAKQAYLKMYQPV